MAYNLPADNAWHVVAEKSITVNGNVTITGKVWAKCWDESITGNTHKVQTKQVVYRSGYSLAGSGYSFECIYCAKNSGSGVWTWEGEETVNGPSDVQTIAHNDDGTKSITMYGFFWNSYWGISEWYDNVVNLPTIPRASTPSIADASTAKNLGSSITISIARASSSFTHTLRIKDGDTVIETIGTGLGTSKSWTPTTATYAPLITNGDTKTFKIECLTFNGNTQIGTKTCDVILKVLDSTVPTISTITLTEGNNLVPNNWGVFVKGISKLIVALTESQSYSAAIVSRNINVEGITYNTNPATTNTIVSSGNVTATITDTRGHTSATKTLAYTVQDYAAPQITSAIIIRCNSNGTDNPDGNYMKYTFTGSISPVANKNAKSFKIQYKRRTSSGQTEDTWHDYFTKTDAYTVNQQSVVGSTQLSSAYTYDIRFIAEDTFSQTTINKVLDTAFDLLNFHKSGRSIAIGKMSEAQDSDKLFECGLDADFKEATNFRKNITYKGYLLDSLFAVEIPIGTILPYSSTTVPSGYMLCDGSAISRTNYADLFAVIGTSYGVGDGSTTFNIPDLRGRVPVGLLSTDGDLNALGIKKGEKTHTLTIDEMPNHNHRCTSGLSGWMTSSAHIQWTGSGSGYRAFDNLNQGGGQPHNNMQPYTTIVYMIKVGSGQATIPSSVTISNADVAQITTNKNAITTLNNKIDNSNTYSSTEIVIGQWVDGKPIYRKVIKSDGIVGSGVNVAHGISDLKRVIKIEVSASSEIGVTYFPYNNAFDIKILQVNETYINANISTGFTSGWPLYWIVEYTKTTD